MSQIPKSILDKIQEIRAIYFKRNLLFIEVLTPSDVPGIDSTHPKKYIYFYARLTINYEVLLTLNSLSKMCLFQ